MMEETSEQSCPITWALDFDDIEHECPVRGGVVRYARYLEERGEWPPPAPVFHVGGDTLLRRFGRHLWLECDAGFGGIVIVEAMPGLGKSVSVFVMARLVDGDFTLENGYIYEGDVFIEALKEPTPLQAIAADEAVGTFMFSRNWSRLDQKSMMQDVWKYARINKKFLFVVAQNARALDWVMRDDVSRWYVKIMQRDPVTQMKYCELLHAIRTPIKAQSVGRWGLASGSATIYRPGGYFTIPPVRQGVVDRYNERRVEGISEPPDEEKDSDSH